MYTLVGTPKTSAFRVLWMLEELGLAYTIVPTAPRDASLAALNPSGKVPILLDGTDAIIDSVAICQYLADKHSRFTFPAGTIKRGQQDSFTQFAVDDVESCLRTAAKHTFILPKDLRTDGVKKACRYDFDRAMVTLSQRLGSNDYVMGDTFTVPDLLLGHCGGWARVIGWPLPEGNVTDHFERVVSRPAYLTATALRKAA